ncbi:MAG: hypothetical protein ACFCBW_15230 [Candidatus Competibacterales bacterium]
MALALPAQENPSNSPQIENLAALCSVTATQELCQATCAMACRDLENLSFFKNHRAYCLREGMIIPTDDPNTLIDDPRCAAIFSTATPSIPLTPSESTSPSNDPDCMALQDVFARAQCIEQLSDCSTIPNPSERAACENKFPPCADSASALLDRSKLLVTEIETELSRYSEVLEIDFSDIRNRENLCNFTRDQLRRYYSDATGDASAIRRLQGRAKDIEACAVDIESWVEATPVGTNNDEFQDNLIRETRSDLSKLNPLRVEVERSVQKLSEAGPKIFGLVRYHLRFCPAPPESGGSSNL